MVILSRPWALWMALCGGGAPRRRARLLLVAAAGDRCAPVCRGVGPRSRGGGGVEVVAGSPGVLVDGVVGVEEESGVVQRQV